MENSPDYHSMVQKLFLTTEQFLNENNATLGQDRTEKLELTKYYFALTLQPDKSLSAIGDR